ncbi:MAG: hypothetical protein RQ739_10760 [Desulfotignum sp.]|nr:hypothetical protein [Desulfotignum sp.]
MLWADLKENDVKREVKMQYCLAVVITTSKKGLVLFSRYNSAKLFQLVSGKRYYPVNSKANQVFLL